MTDRMPVDQGDTVRTRIRRRGSERWLEMRVTGFERDGSIACITADGATRCLMPSKLEVKTLGPRGGTIWLQAEPTTPERNTA